MASAKLARRAGDVLARNRENALKIAGDAGVKKTRALLEEAQRDLAKRIAAKVRGLDGDTFTVVQMRATMAQLRMVVFELTGNLRDVVLEAGGTAAEAAASDVVGYLVAADKAFRGVGTTPLALREASMLDSATRGARSSILRRLASSGEPVKDADAEPHKAKTGILQRYSIETVGHFEKKIRLGMLQGKSPAEMEADITGESTFLQGAPAFWAARIVRCEVMNAYNRSGWESIREADDQLEDMVKVLSGVFDERTAADSYATHGQIRRPEQPFETWYGELQHPPDRPNDRSMVVPHRVSWPIPKYLEWKDDEDVAKAWEREGHKQEMPERPEMTTVALDLFGKPQPKQMPAADSDPDEDNRTT